MTSVITGDIINSRKQKEPEVWINTLKNALSNLSTDTKYWEIYRGDSFQIEIRDYQREAFVHSITKSRCLLLSPTASGKSLIVYLLVRFNMLRLKEEKKKILIIVPTTSLVEQLFKDFKDYGWNPDKNVHKIYQGHDKDTNKNVIISTWQSIYNQPKVWFKQFGMVIGDEAHLFKAVSLTKIMTKLEKCKYRIGLTGTLDGAHTHKLVLEGLLGAVNKVTTTKKLMDKNLRISMGEASRKLAEEKFDVKIVNKLLIKEIHIT